MAGELGVRLDDLLDILSDSESENSSDEDETPSVDHLPASSPLPTSPGPVDPVDAPGSPAVPVALSSSPGPIPTSPIKGGTQRERIEARKRKNAKHASLRMLAQSADREAAAKRAEKEASLAHLPSFHPHSELFHKILAMLREAGTNFGDFFFWVMDPVYKQGVIRYHNFLGVGDSVQRALSLIQRSTSGIRGQVHLWAVHRVSHDIRREARKVTESKLLQTRARLLGGSFFSAFNLEDMKEKIAAMMPTSTAVIAALATNPRYAEKHGASRKMRRSNVIFTTIMQGLSEWSQGNNLFKKVISLYMYATGAQRQQIEVLSHLGMSETYTGLVSKRKRKKRKKRTDSESLEDALATAEPDRTGTIRQLSSDMKMAAQTLGRSVAFAGIYDNINFMARVGEQIIGRTDGQENGTCATIIALWKAQMSDMRADTLIQSFDNARPLQLSDILHSTAEAAQFRELLIYTILRIIVLEGGDSFKRFRGDLAANQPQTDKKIEVHKTLIQPTPAWKIDQSSITGNAEFVDSFYEYLGLRTSPDFSLWVRLLIGDQLSIARLRALLNIRAGQEGGAHGFRNFVLIPGLFHGKIADTHGFFSTHWGKPSTGSRVPGSLYFHNTIIHRLPITLTSLPPFRTCRDLIWVSLYARVLDCLLLVSGRSSLDNIVDNSTTFNDLLGYATAIYDRFLDVDLVQSLRSERYFAKESGLDPAEEKKGDMVYENAVLFLRDAVISREYADAIKSGDSGRVLLVLKIWALSYRGSGRTKYAYEMMSLIHHLTCVWPKPIVDIVLNNWLVNTTGNPNSFLECDLLQEHMNYWIKNFYRTHGNNSATWDWLEMLAPCVVVLRDLTRSLNGLLGADLGTKHKSPDHTKDLRTLIDSLQQHEVHTIQRGRIISEEDGDAVTDVISAGLIALTDATSNPLNEYNAAFQRLQSRCQLPVLVPTTSSPHSSRLSTPSTANLVQPPVTTPDEAEINDVDNVDNAIPEVDGAELQGNPAASDSEDADTLPLDMEDDVALDMDDMGIVSESESEGSDEENSEDEGE